MGALIDPAVRRLPANCYKASHSTTDAAFIGARGTQGRELLDAVHVRVHRRAAGPGRRWGRARVAVEGSQVQGAVAGAVLGVGVHSAHQQPLQHRRLPKLGSPVQRALAHLHETAGTSLMTETCTADMQYRYKGTRPWPFRPKKFTDILVQTLNPKPFLAKEAQTSLYRRTPLGKQS